MLLAHHMWFVVTLLSCPASQESGSPARNPAHTLTTYALNNPTRAAVHCTGLRSFTQLAGMAEPATGALTAEAVRDLTRRAGRLDVVRAVGQVRESVRGRALAAPPAGRLQKGLDTVL